MEDSSRAQVFISYSRRDAEAAERLRQSLLAQGFEAYLDKHDIAAGEDWRQRLGALIESADIMVFLVSPDSVSSSVCDWEVNHAELLGKRIIPVVCRDPDDTAVPERLRRLNYVFMRSEAEEQSEFPKLTEALQVDIAWVRTHTRYGELAADWDRAARPARLLLRGVSIGEAEHWRDSRPLTAPPLTELQSAFIAGSRRGATRRQRAWVAGSLAVALVAVGLSIFAFTQQQAAEAGRRQVVETLASSDYRQGSALVADHVTMPEGIAYLARAARNGSARAEQRLWTLLQQVSFWTPVGVDAAPAPEPVRDPRVPYDVAKRFFKLDLNGAVVDLKSIAISPDGTRIFTAVATDQPDPQSLLVPYSGYLFRIWTSDGEPLTGWIPTPPLLGLQQGFPSGYFSTQNAYLALSQRLGAVDTVLSVFDLAAPGGPTAVSIRATPKLPLSIAFHHRPGETDATAPPLLVVGSGEGANAYKRERDGYVEIGRTLHRAGASIVAVDDTESWLMSAGTDGTVLVDQLYLPDRAAVPIQVDETVVGLAHTAEDVLDVDLGNGERLHLQWRRQVARALQPTPIRIARPGPDQQDCLKTGTKDSDKPFSHSSGLVLSIVDPHRVAVTQKNGVVSQSPRLAGDVGTVCANAAGTLVSITTTGFRTSIWTADFTHQLGPVLDEWALMDKFEETSKTDWVQLTADGSIALIRSSDGLGQSVYLSAWDTGSGLPLMARQLLVQTYDGGEVSGALDENGHILIVDAAGLPRRVIELTPPADSRAGVASYLEALGGRRLSAGNVVEAAEDRIAAINDGNTLFGIAPEAP